AQTGVASVNDVLVRGTTVYLGGHFDHVNGVARSGIAAVDRTTGDLLPWYPGPLGTVSTLVAGPSVLYVGGGFTGGFAAVSIPALPTAVQPRQADNRGFSIERVIPNPMRDHVEIVYALPHSAEVEIGVFDVHGREVSRVEGG